MRYHALALANAGIAVDLIGHAESPLDRATAQNARIALHALPSTARRVPRAPFVVHGLWRVARDGIALARRLATLPRPDVILVQNPPAIPTLPVAGLIARARGARLIVDWHNFGHAMLTLRLPPDHLVVRLARACERAAARLADHHLCVSHAMRHTLAATLGVHGAVVLHDRPVRSVVPADAAGRAALRARLAATLGLPAPDRPAAIVVCPTGWTADEDVGLLLDAAAACDAALARDGGAHPDLIVVLTGDGPLRETWRRRIDALALRRVHVRTHWIAADDYPDVLAAADVGVSVHRSTSGCDLPMKIADLHGAGVPVCALDYGPCLSEMLLPSEENWRFTTADALAATLLRVLAGFRDGAGELGAARAELAATPQSSWQDGWAAVVAPLLQRGAGDERPS